MNQRILYKKLKKEYENIYLGDFQKFAWELTSREIFNVNIYRFINEVVEEENIILSKIENSELKKIEKYSEEFIKTVSKLKRLPEINEEFFEDGTCQRSFYEKLKNKAIAYSKIKPREDYYQKWPTIKYFNDIEKNISLIDEEIETPKKYIYNN